ncbi:MAG: arsenite methyltransferase [Deferrisomatales bacterium]
MRHSRGLEQPEQTLSGDGAVERERIAERIREVYDRVGRQGSRAPGELAVPTGPALARQLGYGEGDLAALPPGVLGAFVGAAALAPRVKGARGDWVVDVGCGAGVDSLLLAGRGLRVVGLDASGSMLGRLAEGARSVRAAAFPVRAAAPHLPLGDRCASWVLLNGVANLIADREALLGEVARVLRPGGRLLVADLVAVGEIPPEVRRLPEAWAWCLGGATSPARWRAELARRGFGRIRIDLLEEIPPFARAVIEAERPPAKAR